MCGTYLFALLGVRTTLAFEYTKIIVAATLERCSYVPIPLSPQYLLFLATILTRGILRRYVHRLYDVHCASGHFTEAGFALMVHVDHLDFTDKILPAMTDEDSSGRPFTRFPEQMEVGLTHQGTRYRVYTLHHHHSVQLVHVVCCHIDHVAHHLQAQQKIAIDSTRVFSRTFIQARAACPV